MTRIRQTNRAFGLMFGTAMIIFASVAWFILDAHIVWLFGVGGGFILIALVIPAILLPINRLWSAFAFPLGRVSNFLLLGLFYSLFILPLGLVFKFFGRDPMQRRTDEKTSSYWQPVNRRAAEDNYPDMF